MFKKIDLVIPRRGTDGDTEIVILSDGTVIFYIDVGDLPRVRAEEYIERCMDKLKEQIKNANKNEE
jgi:hypothetical protein